MRAAYKLTAHLPFRPSGEERRIEHLAAYDCGLVHRDGGGLATLGPERVSFRPRKRVPRASGGSSFAHGRSALAAQTAAASFGFRLAAGGALPATRRACPVSHSEFGTVGAVAAEAADARRASRRFEDASDWRVFADDILAYRVGPGLAEIHLHD
jgi:hypothetical protein